MEGLRNVFASRLDQQLIWVSKEDYEACLKKMSELEDNPEVLVGRYEFVSPRSDGSGEFLLLFPL